MRNCFFLLLICAGSIHASEPSIGLVDYSTPSKYFDIANSLGSRDRIKLQASELKGESDISTIRNILNWMDQNLKYDANAAYSWRRYDDIIKDKTYGGCADQSIVCGVLLKGAGIPVIWVKTMDVSWIWDFKKGRPFKSWSGHVFLEVFVNNKWALLDPGAKMIYKEYSPKTRILPGNRFAYHKGDNPKEMIMSVQWEEWKKQTETYFRGLDESLLPVDTAGGTPLSPEAFVIGNSPYYQTMTQLASEKGLVVRKSFNSEYDKYLPQAQGHVLLIETHDGVPIVSLDVIEKYFPDASKGLKKSSGIARIGETTIVFMDFSKKIRELRIEDSAKEE